MPSVAGVSHLYVEVDGLQLHCAEAGEGEPLVLLHGWPQHWWSWRHVIGPLAERYRVICPDIRGLGWSEAPPAPSPASYSLHRLAHDLVGLLDALGLSRVRVVGHDWGALITYRACLDFPQRFDRAVALGAVHPWASSGAPVRTYLRPWHIYTLAVLGLSSPLRPRIAAHCLHSWRRRGRCSPEEVETYLATLSGSRGAAATRAFDRNIVAREIPYFVRHHRELRLRVPMLHINGADDPLTQGVPDCFKAFADEMSLELIGDCGHFLAEERPSELVERVASFMAEGAAPKERRAQPADSTRGA